MSFDPKCFELAQYFYPLNDGAFHARLAAAIQEIVEDASRVPSPPKLEFSGPHLHTARNGEQAWCDIRYCRYCIEKVEPR